MTGGPLLWPPSSASVLRSSSENTSALCCLLHWTHYNLHTAVTVPQTMLLPSRCWGSLEWAPASSGPSTPALWRASWPAVSPPGLETAPLATAGLCKKSCELPATLLEVSFPPSRTSTQGGVQGRIIKDSSHPSHWLLSLLPSGRRLHSIRSRTSRLRDSIFPQAIRLMNSQK